MHTESSVIVNLAEIMQLEHERVAAERAAEQAARELVVRARQEQAERARREVERAARVQERLRVRAARRQERQERERELALLRVRLDADARARLQREALELGQARAQAAEGVAQPRARRGRAWPHAAWLLALAAVGASSFMQLRRSASELALARAAERQAHSSTAAAAEERTRLHAELRALRSKPATTTGDDPTTPAAPDALPAAAPGRPVGKVQATASRPRPQPSASSVSSSREREQPVPLGELEDLDDDPLGGLIGQQPSRRRR